MSTREVREVRTDSPPVADDAYAVSSGRTVSARLPWWSPAQLIGLVIGIGFTVLGIAAVARTGFNTGHVFTPHDVIWHLPHSPLLGAIEIGYGVLMILAAVIPGGARSLMTLLGAISLAFGIVVLVEGAPSHLNDWLAVTRRSGWLFVIVGAVVVLASMFAPVFGGDVRRRVVRDEQVVS